MSDKKRIYTVPVRYVFRGEFKIQAASKAQAEEYAEKLAGWFSEATFIHRCLMKWLIGIFPYTPKKS